MIGIRLMRRLTALIINSNWAVDRYELIGITVVPWDRQNSNRVLSGAKIKRVDPRQASMSEYTESLGISIS